MCLDDDSALRRAKSLLTLGLDLPRNEPPLGPGSSLGDYRLLDLIDDRGSTCYVFRAVHVGSDRVVALKVMKDVAHADPADIRRFWGGATAAADLSHPNIVSVPYVGDADGPPYFVMTLMTGGNLKDSLARLRESQDVAAQLLVKIARAVHHAHERGVLHRDLKPANILLDEQDEPHVADFGIAKRLDRRSSLGASTGMRGTLDYMAPEQLSGNLDELTCAADIYALGAMLYELLTGHLPHEGSSEFEVIQKKINFSPIPPPRTLNPGLNPSLENICLRCLDPVPGRRYQTAAELAEDLESARKGRRIRPPVSLPLRTLRFAQRHPTKSIGALALSLLVVMIVAVGLTAWRAEASRARAELSTDSFVATGKALEVLFQLREYADRAVAVAGDGAISELFARREPPGEARELEARIERFDSLFLVSSNGFIRAQWPAPDPDVFRRDFSFRDYFQGGMRMAEAGLRGAYLARAFLSETSRRLEFAFSVPVRDRRGLLQGFFVATINAKNTLGQIVIEDPDEEAHMTAVLLGPRGNDRVESTSQGRSDFTFLVHPALHPGDEYALVSPNPADLRTAFGVAAPPGKQFGPLYVPPLKVPFYRDPLPGFEGQWLAAFAPVGKTGFVVAVQTRRQAYVDWRHALSAGSPARWAVVFFVGFFSLIVAGLWLVRRRGALS